MATPLAEAFVRLRADGDGFQREAGGVIGGAVGKLGGVMAGLFAAGQVADFFGEAISGAQESAKVSALTAQVIKSTGGAAGITATQVGDLATSISNLTGIDDEAVQGAENLLLTFTNVRNAAGKNNDVFNQATGIVADMSVALGTDMKSASLQVGKALNDPVKGITALSRAGVSFTEQQKNQIKTLVASGDTLGAQKIILGELNKEFGGAAAASATNVDKVKVVFGNLQEQIGGLLLPVIEKVAGFLSSTVIPVFSRFFDGMQKGTGVGGAVVDFFGKIKDAVTFVIDLFRGDPLANMKTSFAALEGNPAAQVFLAVRDAAVAAFGWLKANAVPALQALGGFITGQVIPAVRSLATWFAANVLPVLRSVGSFIIGTIVPALLSIARSIISAVIPIALALWNTFKARILPALQALWQVIATKVIPFLMAVARVIIPVITFLVKLVAAILSKVVPVLVNILGAAIGFVIKVIAKIIGMIVSWISFQFKIAAAVVGAIGKIIGFFARMGSAVGSAIGAVISWFAGLPRRILSAVGNLGSTLIGAGKDLVQGLIDGVKRMGSALVRAIVNLIPGPVRAVVQKALGIDSPSTVMRDEIGRWIPLGIIEGIAATAPQLQRAMGSLVDVPALSVPAPRTAAGTGALTGPSARSGVGDIHIWLGDREIHDIVRVEVGAASTATARALANGRRP